MHIHPFWCKPPNLSSLHAGIGMHLPVHSKWFRTFPSAKNRVRNWAGNYLISEPKHIAPPLSCQIIILACFGRLLLLGRWKLNPERDYLGFSRTVCHLPGGLELMGELGWRAVLVIRVFLLLKKLRKMPHFSDSSRVLFPAPECPKSFSLILGWMVWVGRSCWM